MTTLMAKPPNDDARSSNFMSDGGSFFHSLVRLLVSVVFTSFSVHIFHTCKMPFRGTVETSYTFDSTRHVYLPICNRNIARFKWIKIDWRVMDEIGRGRERKNNNNKNAKVWTQFWFWWRKLTHKTRFSGRICFVNVALIVSKRHAKKKRERRSQPSNSVSWWVDWFID